MPGLGRLLLVAGIVLVVAGLLVLAAGRLPGGKMPGDLALERGNFRFYFPLGTSIVLSVVLSLVLWLFSRR